MNVGETELYSEHCYMPIVDGCLCTDVPHWMPLEDYMCKVDFEICPFDREEVVRPDFAMA